MRTLKIFAHSRDCNNFIMPNGSELEGYVLEGIGIGGGDDIEITIDIDTGKIVGWTNEHRDAVLHLQDL